MKAPGVNRIPVLLLTFLLIVVICFPHPGKAQPVPVNIVSYRVDGAPNYNAPGNESFWRNIGWTNVSLSASVSPGGGHTSSVLVKSANDGFNIYVLFRWYDAKGPSFGSDSEIYLNSSGQPTDLNPDATGIVHQLIYNSTYYYQDRAAMLWFLNGTRDVNAPAMKLNSTGAITDGSANIWHWQSVPTDNSPNDPDFPGGYNDTRGNPIFPPNNSSFAEDDYTDKNGFFLVAGNSSQTPPVLDAHGNPFLVLTGNSFSTTNKTWTVEMVRQFTVSEDSKYRVQLSVGSSYFVGFAIWNGRMGESAHIKSVSQWYSLTVSNQSPPTPPTPATGVSLTLAVAAGGGLLLAGLIIGVVAKPQRRKTG